jgi:hypothetical protein
MYPGRAVNLEIYMENFQLGMHTHILVSLPWEVSYIVLVESFTVAVLVFCVDLPCKLENL